MLVAVARASRALRTSRTRSSLRLTRALHLCSCPAAPDAAKLGLQQPLFPAQPGTVAAFQHHVFVRPWSLGDGLETCASWPPAIEREPAFAKVFAVVAQHKQHIEGVVRVTAFESFRPVPLNQECCEIHIFPAGIQYTNVRIDDLDSIVQAHTSIEQSQAKLPEQVKALEEDAAGRLHLYVCCHGSRDARCGVIGPALSNKLQRLVDMRGLQDNVAIHMCSHIGGHKFAGNVLVYGALSPCDGDWFGGIHADNADHFLEALLNLDVDSDGGPADEGLKPFWRGRLGYSKLEQLAFHSTGQIPESVRPAGSDLDDEEHLTQEDK